MRQKPHHPDKGFTGKKTYYETRGKVHLINAEGFQDVATKTWCGLGLDSANNTTMEIVECTCQRCLMHKTKTWGGKERGKCSVSSEKSVTRGEVGGLGALLVSERKLNALKR